MKTEKPVSDELEQQLKDLFIQHQEYMAWLSLSKNQIEVLNYIRSRKTPVTSKQLAKKLKISVANASTKLAALYKKGYLAKSVGVAPSDGIENYYIFFNGQF